MDRLQWLLDRQQGIGSSDAPNLVGVGFGDAGQVYRSKVLPPDAAEPKSGPLARGIALESLIAERYAEEMGCELRTSPGCRHPARSWQSASPDRVRSDGRCVELKSTAWFGDQWGPTGSDIIPDGYAVQVQHQMGVLGAESIDLAALDVVSWEFRCYRIGFDSVFFNWLTQVEGEFWHRFVLAKNPPGPDWEARFKDGAVVAELVERGSVKTLGQDAAELVERRKELGTIRDEADEEYRRLGSRLEAMMGTAETAIAGGWKIKRIQVAGGSYTAERKPYARLDIRPVKGKGAER